LKENANLQGKINDILRENSELKAALSKLKSDNDAYKAELSNMSKTSPKDNPFYMYESSQQQKFNYEQW